jgi:hypothetical protein
LLSRTTRLDSNGCSRVEIADAPLLGRPAGFGRSAVVDRWRGSLKGLSSRTENKLLIALTPVSGVRV